MNVSRRWLEAFVRRPLDPQDVARRLAALSPFAVRHPVEANAVFVDMDADAHRQRRLDPPLRDAPLLLGGQEDRRRRLLGLLGVLRLGLERLVEVAAPAGIGAGAGSSRSTAGAAVFCAFI